MIPLLTSPTAIQVGRFGAVGILNTVLDFVIFNSLSSKRGFSKIKANVCSTTISMIVSFVLQRQIVFGVGTGNPLTQALLFFLVTGFGLYVLQNMVIYLLVGRWKWPNRAVHIVSNAIHLGKRFSDDFLLKNAAKLLATIVSLIWNYLMYRRAVFRV
jgi:putative flippase GtrA